MARRGESARRASEHRSEAERRAALANAGINGLTKIVDTLKSIITQAAPTAAAQLGRDGGWTIRLDQAVLEFEPATATSQSPWESWESPAFEVIAHAALGIEIPHDRQEYGGRSHSLWYCDAVDAGRFQWFETAFMISAMSGYQSNLAPFALSPSEAAAKALWRGLAEYQVAWPYTPLIVGELNEFIDRWASWFADAAQGRFQHPRSMPERQSEGSWRLS